MKHTPGPWVKVGQRGKFDGNYNIQQENTRGMLMSFVKIFGPNDIVHPDFAKDAEANANLIAAAPEMLEACEDALLALEHLARTGHVDDECNNLLRAAIAKAKGESL